MSLLLGMCFTSPKQPYLLEMKYPLSSWVMWNIGTFTNPCSWGITKRNKALDFCKILQHFFCQANHWKRAVPSLFQGDIRLVQADKRVPQLGKNPTYGIEYLFGG